MSEDPLVITLSSGSEGEDDILNTSYQPGKTKVLTKSNISSANQSRRKGKRRSPLTDITSSLFKNALFDKLVQEGPTNSSFKSSEYSTSEINLVSSSSDGVPSPILSEPRAKMLFPHELPKKPPAKAKKKKGQDEELIPLSFMSSLSDIPPGFSCHPDALPYKKAFKKNREPLGKYLYQIFNEQVFQKQLPSDMEVFWTGRLRNTSGVTYSKSILTKGVKVYIARIGLSTQVITTPDRLRDTLIHEMCHAATWIVDRVKEGHGAHWKRWTQIAREKFPELPPIKVCHEYEIKRKFTYECTLCQYKIGRNTKSLDTMRFKCGYCSGRFAVYLTSTGQVSEAANKKLTPFALYVKENYNDIKQLHPDKSHKERMTLLGTQFKLSKVKVDSCVDAVSCELEKITLK